LPKSFTQHPDRVATITAGDIERGRVERRKKEKRRERSD